MTAPAAIRAVFAEWRMVKTRKVLALVFEVSLEQQGEVLTILGAPMPDAEIWCGIARLNLSAIQPIRSNDAAADPRAGEAVAASQRGGDPFAPTRSDVGKQRYAASSDMEKALIRAARMPSDTMFQDWVAKVTEWHACTEEDAIQYIRDVCCDGGSRRLISEDDKSYQRFMRMETTFKIATNQMAEPR